MTDKIKKGKEGESLAAQHLEDKGFVILERNYRYKRSEIDLIATRDDWLIFVEVKVRSSAAFGFPESFVDRKKADKIMEGALNYLVEKDWKGKVRYDIIAITEHHSGHELVHFEDAFY